jgi:hypothetical protein
MMLEAQDRNEARQVVPPPYRDRARVIQLNRFSREEISALLKQHGA